MVSPGATGALYEVYYGIEDSFGVVGTAGNQEITFTSGITGVGVTGLTNDATVYQMTVDVDGGGAATVYIVGAEAQTFSALITRLNNDIVGASASIVGGAIRIISDTIGASSSIAIVDVTLAAALTNFSAITSAVAGTGSVLNLLKLPLATEDLNLTKEPFEDDTLRADGNVFGFRHGNRTAAGSVSGSLRYGSWEDWMAAALYADISWPADLIKNGVTPTTMIIESAATDITNFKRVTGAQVAGMTITVPPTGPVTVAFDVVAQNLLHFNVEFGSPSAHPGNVNAQMVHFEGSMKYDGATVARLTSFTFATETGAESDFDLFSNTAGSISRRKFRVTGTLTARFIDKSFADNFSNEDTVDIELTLVDKDDVAKKYVFDMPTVTLNAHEISVGDDGPLVQTIGFQATYDANLDASMSIKRV